MSQNSQQQNLSSFICKLTEGDVILGNSEQQNKYAKLDSYPTHNIYVKLNSFACYSFGLH